MTCTRVPSEGGTSGMNLWTIFVTGLFAGGASCAAVQGGLLVASVARREGKEAGPAASRSVRSRPSASRQGGKKKSARSKNRRPPAASRSDRAAAGRRAALAEESGTSRAPALDDAVPVAGFLAGKLVSHAMFGALLGLLGESMQISVRTRAVMQIAAGLLMVLMAANLLGLTAVRSLVPSPPAALSRIVRRSARSQAVFGPALLGFLTILIPCGVTLSIMFLAIAAGSPIAGAAAMATFVVGTSPLFAAVGFAVRRSARALQGRVATLAALAVLVAGVFTINTGLALRRSSATLSTLWASLSGATTPADVATAPAATVSADGVQRLVIEARDTSFSPRLTRAKAGVPTVLTVRTSGTQGCTRGFVIPSADIQRVLPETGDTEIDVGRLEPGTLRYTCSMGMYGGTIEVA
ncbi:MAG: sulfite exporter TauE/SafE family protein [Actinomycetota bacterium]|nr:sulfite exporter TauE/SafE family protein [Actinomycetota bacterium]